MFEHIPVLYDDVLKGLRIRPEGIYLDGTVGGGGHAYGILEQLGPKGHLIAVDQDIDALEAARTRLMAHANQVTFVHDNFVHIGGIADRISPTGLDGILLDIGVSSFQLDEPQRGFSYMRNAPLDMRMNQSQELTCRDVVNTYSEDALEKIIKDFGEERWARRIAKIIIERRQLRPIETTFDLVDVIERAIPAGAREKGSHVAKRTFQALRIEVNDELGVLERVLDDAIARLRPGGRMAVITFHSLEDRIVKEKFRWLASRCICPPEMPICNCNKKPTIRLINRKPIVASTQECAANRRAASAKLRVAEKTDEAGENRNG